MLGLTAIGLVLTFCRVHPARAFDPAHCESGTSLEFSSNGFKIIVESSTEARLAETSDEIGGLTYRQALDSATQEARRLLRNITVDDAPFLKTMKSVPFRIEEKSDGAHFFYSGRGCSTGCVVTETAARLIRDIYNDPTLLLHEYAHVYQLALPQTEESKACDSAYENWKDTVFPELDKTEHPFDEKTYGSYYWYAWANSKEYFAVTTEGFNEWGQRPLNKWPETRQKFEKDDQKGFAAVKAFWSMSPDKIDTAIAECVQSSGTNEYKIWPSMAITLLATYFVLTQ